MKYIPKLSINPRVVMEYIPKWLINSDESDLTELTEKEYKAALVDIDKELAKAAFNKAWEIRNFEIEMYWKRATYFWAFIAVSFAGYFALINSKSYLEPDRYNHVEVYFLICLGFILSVAWVLINKGSKAWQRQWEVHVDLLEEQFTGPLYKIVHPKITYSVSKINEIISVVFSITWILLGVKYLVDQHLINFGSMNINWFVLASTLGVVVTLVSMFCGHGRGRFSNRSVSMSKRSVTYN